MVTTNNLPIKLKVMLSFIVLGTIPLILLSTIIANIFSNSIKQQTLNQLTSIRNLKTEQLKEHFSSIETQVQYFSGDVEKENMSEDNTFILNALYEFHRASKYLSKDEKEIEKQLSILYKLKNEDSKISDGSRDYYDNVHEDFHPKIKSFTDQFSIEDVYLVQANGLVLYSVKKGLYFGKNIKKNTYQITGISQSFNMAIAGISEHKNKEYFISGYQKDDNTGEIANYISIPIFEFDRFVGVIIYKISLTAINNIMLNRSGLGETGETYLVNSSAKIVSTLRRNIQHSTPTPDTPAVKSALAGKTQQINTTSYTKEPVFSAYTSIDIFGDSWALVTEITTQEALADINKMIITGIIIIGITLLFILLVGFYLSNGITKPLVMLTKMSEIIASGDLKKKIGIVRHDEVGRLAASFSLMQDAIRHKIQEAEQMNKELVKLGQFKDNLLANTSHELRTPLNGIIGLAESIVDHVEEQQVDTIKTIISSGRRLANLVNDILDATTLKDNKMAIFPETLNLRQLVDIDLSSSRMLVGKKSLSIENKVPEDCYIFADQNRLLQILQNLMGNAIKFTQQGTIKVLAAKTGNTIEVRVIDTGIGINEKNQEKIFLSFQQADLSSTRKFGGTGLGLSITKQLIELHGGNIHVKSEPNKGSEFIFTLPAGEKTTQPLHLKTVNKITPLISEKDKAIATTPDKVLFTILAIDDEPVNLKVLASQLHRSSWQLILAQSGEEALTIIENKKPDLVLLDIMMPDMDGFEVCQTIRQRHSPSDLPIVFFTAKNQPQDIVQGFLVGGNDYIPKPFFKDEVCARITTHLNLVVGRQRMTTLKSLFSQLGEFETHEEILKAGIHLLMNDPHIDDAAVFFDDDLLMGNESGLLEIPTKRDFDNEVVIEKNDKIAIYSRVSSFYIMGVIFQQYTSEEWVTNVASQISHAIGQIRKISNNPKNALIMQNITPYLDVILYIKVEKNYCVVVKMTGDSVKESILRIPFKQILLNVSEQRLLQVHRSYAVNPDKISFIHGKQQTIQLEGHQCIPVARKYMSELKEKFPQHYDVVA